MQKIEGLKKLGLTEGESKVYAVLLETGPSTVGPVVRKSGVAYSNIYEILQRLMSKGLASFIVKGKTKYFQASDPENLGFYLERRKKEIEEQKEILSALLPNLKAVQKNSQEDAEIFVGIKGVKAAYLKLFSENKNEELIFFYIHKPEYAKDSDIFYKSISKLSAKRKNRGICNKEYKKSKFAKVAKFLNMRYADFPIPGNIDVCSDKILVISWGPKPTAFLLRSKQVADSLKEYFESVWKMSKK